MAVKGTPKKFHQKYMFVVEIDGVESAHFKDMSELSAEFAEVTVWQGGTYIPRKEPGRLTVSDVTLSRGVVDGDNDLWEWFLQTGNATANVGEVDDEYRRPVELVQLDRDGSVLRRWILNNAWPKKIVVGEWDNDSDEILMESVVLAFDSFDKLQG